MKLIAHRGNLDGPHPITENNIIALEHAISQGYDVECDVWYRNGRYVLNHDDPGACIDHQYLRETSIEWLRRPEVWAHAKTRETCDILTEEGVNVFYLEDGDASDWTWTSKGHFWLGPKNEKAVKNCVLCMPEYSKWRIKDFNVAYAICSDYITKYDIYR